MELQDQTPENFNPKYSQSISYILLIIGLFFLYFGSKYFILGSKELATYFNVSETIIGLTLVAFGTSLPELATGIVAAFRKQANLGCQILTKTKKTTFCIKSICIKQNIFIHKQTVTAADMSQ